MGKRSAEVSADVLDAICDSAVDPSAWARLPTVLAHIAKAQACAIYYDTGAAVGDLAAYNLEEYRPDSVACCQRLDPWPKLGWAAAGLTGKFDEQIFRQSDLKTPIYFPHCTRYFWLCCLLSVNAPLSQDLYFKIGLHRPRGAKPFSPEVKAKLDLLLPHIQRALQVRLRAMESGKTSHHRICRSFSTILRSSHLRWKRRRRFCQCGGRTNGGNRFKPEFCAAH